MTRARRANGALACAAAGLALVLSGGTARAGCIPVYGQIELVPGLGGPSRLVAADLNGDGRPDLVAVVGDRLVSAINDGLGRFLPPVTIAEGSGRFVVADFDGDGKPDVAFANVTAYATEIYSGIGDGTFHRTAIFPVPYGYPFDVAAGDFDGDGKTDLAILLGSSVEVHLQRNGTLVAAGVLSSADPDAAAFWAIDLDGDGRVDLLCLHAQFGGSGLFSLQSQGNGSFLEMDSGIRVGTYRLFHLVASGDLNHDGRPDVVVVSAGNGSPATLQVFRAGAGAYEESAVLTLARTAASGVAVVDFEGTGSREVAVLLFGTGDATAELAIYRALDANRLFFASSQTLRAGDSFAFADFDGDGVMDLLLWSRDDVYSPYLMRGTCPTGPAQQPVRAEPVQVAPRRRP